MTPDALILALLFFAAAVLYASVGHAGASAYLAAMALVGVAPETMRPTALVLNLFVAGVVIARFSSAGHLPWRHLVPLAVGSVPAAFVGGSIELPGELYRPLVAAVLLVGAWRLATAPGAADTPRAGGPPVVPALAAGAAIGLLAGLTGTGGGIFLTPLLVLAGWAGTRDAAGLSGAFILVNSLAGLGGLLTTGLVLPPAIGAWIGAVLAGGLIGSWLGAARFSVLSLRRALAVVLVVAAAKLVFLP
ncbi:MAG TPA: sulfite exporter TauE/SafE family protein [Candidatus Limnocylindria bacterium]|nr:sulfite exporter TauE/SafE family protein [Candidatus Limnocylindria bacterium]